MKNSELAKRFVHGEAKGKGSHMFIEGNVIYSWGYHFPIAMRVIGGYDFLLNTTKFSSSTSRHQFYVRRALQGLSFREVNKGTMNEACARNMDEATPNVIVLERHPVDIDDLCEMIVQFLKREGVKKVDANDKEMLLQHVRRLMFLKDI